MILKDLLLSNGDLSLSGSWLKVSAACTAKLRDDREAFPTWFILRVGRPLGRADLLVLKSWLME